MTTTPEKFQNVWYKTVRGVAPTSYPRPRVTNERKKKKKKKNEKVPKAEKI